MSTEGVNVTRRRFLLASTTAVGAVGTGFVAYPFIASMQPSAKTQAAGAPVEVDISKMEPGQRLIVEWRGKPVWIVKRTEETLQGLKEQSLLDRLRDPDSNKSEQPDYAKNEYRAVNPEYFVVIGICTHLGCSPSYIKKDDPHSLPSWWAGGFFCPCHGSYFDLAGRVFTGVPAPLNLVIPKHKYYADGTKVMIGVDPDEGAAS